MRTLEQPGNFAVDVGYVDPSDPRDAEPMYPLDELDAEERAEYLEARGARAHNVDAARSRGRC